MKQVVVVHGSPYKEKFYDKATPSPSNSSWTAWLQKQVALKDGLCQALEYPRPYDPIYEEWLEVFKQHALSDETVLIGHSCGGGFLLRFLSENQQVKVKKVILVAPWLDPDGELTTNFFKFALNPNLASNNEVHVMISDDDDDYILKSVEMVKEQVPNIIWHNYSGKGHFVEKDCPELLELL